MGDENSQKLVVRIVNVDYYLSKPIANLSDPSYSGFRSLPISYVPIIRIFGPTYSGVKTCVHIHGVFPYIFVANWDLSVDEKDLYQFAVILDKAINTSFANSAAKTCHVYRISAVLGRPFYGFHADEKQFLKIEFFNPAIIKRAAELLLSGAVFNTCFQPYEAHVPYILQFFIDNNLYGMNYIALSSYKFRYSEDNVDDPESHPNITKQSYCALEIDANVDAIVDMHQSMENMPNNPGLAFIWEEEKRRRRILNKPSQITLVLSQDRPARPPTRTESYFRDKMADKLTLYKRPSTPSLDYTGTSQCSESEDTELNTQSRSVLSLLEKLMEEKETNNLCTSSSSSPSVVYSDDENEIYMERSQPVLKLNAENDSILGDHFSDNEMDEIDDIDHYELSQSFVRSHYEKLLSSDDSDVGNYDHVPQLDGATSPKLSRRRVSKTGSRSKRTYNLRSNNTHPSAADMDGSRHSRISDTKQSPRKYYPQLQIDTQKSPKCTSLRQTLPNKECSIPATSSSASQSAEAHSRVCPVEDSLRTDFRRPYPQLGINIKKSPRSIQSKEKHQPTSQLRKRKINFNENTLASDGSFDISSVTVRWKKQRLKSSTPVGDECSDSLPMDGDINSQKYSLKIRFDSDELEEKMYSDVLLKKPAIVLKRISLEQNSVSKGVESLVPSECLAASLVSDTVQESGHPNSRMEVELSSSSAVNKRLKSNDEQLPILVRRKRLGMRMRAQKNIEGQEVGSTDHSQEEVEQRTAANVVEGCQSKSMASDEHITKEDAFSEQSSTTTENAEGTCLINPKHIESCDISISLTDINKLDFDRSKKNLEISAECSENREFCKYEMTDSIKRFQFTDKSYQSNNICTRKVRLRNIDGSVGERNVSKNSRLKKFKAAGAEKNSKIVECEHSQTIDVVEPRLNDNEKTLKSKNENNIENFKIRNVSVNLKAIDIGRFVSNDESTGSNASEDLLNIENIEKVGTEAYSKSTETSNNMNSVHLNELCPKEFTALNANAEKGVPDISPLESSVDQLADASKPCFSDIDVIMVINEEENHLGITSSDSNSDLNCESVFPNVDKADDVDKTNVNLIDDEEIDRIALSIINRTTNAFNPTGDETIKFTEIPNIEEVPSTQELSNSIKVIESVPSDIDQPTQNCVNRVGKPKDFVIDEDELILSDEDTHLKLVNTKSFISSEENPNHLGTAINDRSVIDETIKFTELECEDDLNGVELMTIETRLDKSIANEFSPTRINEIAKNSLDLCNNIDQISFEHTKSPVSKMVINLQKSIRIGPDENRLNSSEQLHCVLPVCQKSSSSNLVKSAEADEIFPSQRSSRAVKSLRWALNVYDNAPSISRQPQRSKNEGPEKMANQCSPLFAASPFTSTGDQNDVESPSADTHLLNRSQTQELFSPPTKISQSSDEDIVQIYCVNGNCESEKNLSSQPGDGPSSSAKKNASPCSLDTLPASKVNYKFDNSIWYSSDEENDDNRVCSLYHNESASSPEVILFPESRLDVDSPKGVDPVTGSNEKSSQEINNSGSDILLPSQSPSFVSLTSKDFVADDSPTSAEGGHRRILHSTPTGRKSKKSPSPTYTPIYKNLMLKVMNEEKKYGRRELKMEDIKEEVETKAVDVSPNLENNSITKSENGVENKSNYSSRVVNSIGSGRIDATMNDTYGFKIDLENLQSVKADMQFQYITVMSLELFAETRLDLNPDPEYDPISCVFYTVFHDAPNVQGLKSGMIIVNSESYQLDLLKYSCHKEFVQSEDELFESFVNIIRQYDPDIFLGYEIEMLSWGYLIQRGQHKNRNCYAELSRVKDPKTKEFKDKSVVDDGDYSNELKLVGRIVLNVWRLMRHEIALQSYTFENIMFHIMHQRAPQYSFRSLTQWWTNSLQRWMVIDYYLFRTENNILILQQLDFFGKTSELAKLFGIQFYEVLSRGSQFRVESMMLRLAKTQNFIAMSPNPKQRASMRAPECLPLIMEPESKYYREPVIVLDFQSLYPSIIIAYNYCFSTCLGRVQHLVNNETFEFGCAQHTVPIDLLLKLESSLNISPCGVAFVNRTVRRGILPAMLEEILETRLMVKKSMKQNKNNSILQRVLHARQLGLKLIANVTYGYTSANFSGRMPCIEIGDSVVSKGRETLERAIELISANEIWQAKVIYGDTDSIFVMVPGRSKEEAFCIGTEIVDAVTNDNPKPVKLKLEKVYYPCILQTKKRYVGYMYESADQKEPVYDAKGIETVRRDGCPAVAKILEKCLKLLFETNNVDTVKCYVQHQFSKIISGRLSIQELTFAREYRGMTNYKPAACVPALQLARHALVKDRRAEPRVKERVRYVLIAGPPNVPLIRLVRTPEQFLSSPGSLINAEYYITRAIIPALERCFALMNVNVQNWYTELPRKKQFLLPVQNDMQNRQQKKKTAIFQYFASSKCISCGEVTVSSVCKKCEQKPQQLAIVLGNLINSWQRKYNYISKICRSCSRCNEMCECLSLDCPVYYTRCKATRDVEQVPFIEELQHKYLPLISNLVRHKQRRK